MADGGGWSTIESDEGVFTSLIENLGVKDVQFEELISLDPDTIRSLSPVYGVIFLFKYMRDPPQNTTSTTSTPQDGHYDTTSTSDPSSTLFFAHQTIQNACATQAILSIILNQSPPIPIGAELSSFKDFTAGFPPDLRGETLSNSERIRSVHNAFARASPFVDETVRDQGEDGDGDVFHFIAYTVVDGVLYELDGLQPWPISHGRVGADDGVGGGKKGGGEGEGEGEEEEAFPEKLIGVLQRRIARYPVGETRFNLMAVVRDLRAVAREIGDMEMLEREERKRRAWEWENTLRRSNFVGFIGEMVKGVAGRKEREGKFDEWVEKAQVETQKKLLRRQ